MVTVSACERFGEIMPGRPRSVDNERKRHFTENYQLVILSSTNNVGTPVIIFMSIIILYPVHAKTRKSFGEMTRKLSVTASQ
jgi:hypothetical protein